MGVIELADAAIATSGRLPALGRCRRRAHFAHDGPTYRRWRVGWHRSRWRQPARQAEAVRRDGARATPVPDYARQRGLDALFIVRDGGALRTIGTGCFADEAPSS
jgi:thiamine biosynthesis lipoprotein